MKVACVNLIYTCLNCLQAKQYNEFTKDSSKKKGIKRICKECNKNNSKKLRDLQKSIKPTIKCVKCGVDTGRTQKQVKYCSDCLKLRLKEKRTEAYKKQDKEKLKERNRIYRIKNKEKENKRCRDKSKKYREKNRDKINEKSRIYRINNKEKINKTIKKYRENNFWVKIRSAISCRINETLKLQGVSKNGTSCLFKLDYTIQQLMSYLESKFELWMTWSNWGKYDPKIWDDNDPATWTWQIDHIIPCSELKYDSMDHPNFIKCWSLENLRPLSAKQNFLDGIYKNRVIINALHANR